jgi:hypothetical protein
METASKEYIITMYSIYTRTQYKRICRAMMCSDAGTMAKGHIPNTPNTTCRKKISHNTFT